MEKSASSKQKLWKILQFKEQLYLNKRMRARSIPAVIRLAGQIIPLVN